MKQTVSLDALCPYIREVGMQRMDSWKNRPRRIYDHQFLYCFTGIAHVILGEQYCQVTPGDLVIIHPNVPHQLWVEETPPGELYWFHCDFYLYPDRDWVFQYYNAIEQYITLFGPEIPHKEHVRENPVFLGGRQLPTHLRFPDVETLAYSFRTMYRAYISGDVLWQLTARRCFYDILEHVLREGCQDDAQSQKVYLVNLMKAYIAKHYFENINVASICQGTGLNAEYASKRFRQETGSKLVEYVSWFRVNQAKKLLIDTDLSIADVAEMVGFHNENYFCSVVKKLEGKTPAKLRAHLLALMADEQA